MYCRKCGKENDDNAYKCVNCGQTLQQINGPPPVTQYIPNYLVQAILVTIFCCLFTGIPAIVYAAQVNGYVQSGNIPSAIGASKNAKM